MLGFITANFLPVCVKIVAALAMFSGMDLGGCGYRQFFKWLGC